MDALHQYLYGLAEETARADPRVFVGRADERRRILQAASRLPPEGPRSQTVLVEGAPGSGKTSLLTHMAALFVGAEPATGVHVLRTPPGSTEDVESVYGDIATELADAPSADVPSVTQKAVRFRGSAGVVSVEGSKADTQAHPVFWSASSVSRWRRARNAGDWGPKHRVVVFVDEVQEVEPGSPATELLKDLHAQGDIPVLLVCAGLGNSERRLSDAGLSRVEQVVTLGRFEADEAEDCARRTLRMAVDEGVRGTDADIARWAQRVARASDDWPRHLHVYLQGVWTTLLGQDVPDLGTADMDAAIQAGDSGREAYYRSRLDAAKTPVSISRLLHERIARDGGLSQQQARDTIREAFESAGKGEREDWREQFDSTGECFFALLRAGVISLDGSRRCVSPIPSFSRFILEDDPPEGRRAR